MQAGQGKKKKKVHFLPVERVTAVTKITAGNCEVELIEQNFISCSNSNDSHRAR